MLKPRYKQTDEQFQKAREGKTVVFYGRGAAIGEAIHRYDKPEGYIVDENSELWGASSFGMEICSPLRLYGETPATAVVLVTAGTRYARAITKHVREIGDFDIFYYPVLANEFLGDISMELFEHYAKIQAVERLLYDDKSRQVLREVIHRRMIGCSAEFGDLKVEGEPQYLFPPMYRECFDEEIILDCGGYIGDTAEKFIRFFDGRAKKIYSFEALPQNREKLQEKQTEFRRGGWHGELRILPLAVSDRTGRITFCETSLPGGSFSPAFRTTTKFHYVKPVRKFEVEACTIDEVIPATEKVTLIKMDIEGAEHEALLGAEKLIKGKRPRLAISIYHNACDYWRICELVKRYVPEYKLAIRHHKDRHVDTVLYAWIERK